MKNPRYHLSHEPVMVKEVLEYLYAQPGDVILDCTIGCGGHSLEIIEKIKPDGYLIGVDRDSEILTSAKENLSAKECPFSLFHANFSDVDEVLKLAKVDGVNGVLLDLGTSSLQFDSSDRGFSFAKEGPLDMRMDRSQKFTARDLLQRMPVKEIETLLKKYGEERWSRRIARVIVKERKVSGIKTTTQLANIIQRVVPTGKRKINPATRVFQAIRIAVNKELECLETFLDKIPQYMLHGTRIVVISFHSLEDRIVKNKFKEKSDLGLFRITTKKPIRPSEEEIEKNIRCRSAKLRAAERI